MKLTRLHAPACTKRQQLEPEVPGACFKVRFFAFYVLRPRQKGCGRRLRSQKSRSWEIRSRKISDFSHNKRMRSASNKHAPRRSAAGPDGLGTAPCEPLARADPLEAASHRPERPGSRGSAPSLGTHRDPPHHAHAQVAASATHDAGGRWAVCAAARRSAPSRPWSGRRGGWHCAALRGGGAPTNAPHRPVGHRTAIRWGSEWGCGRCSGGTGACGAHLSSRPSTPSPPPAST